MLKSFDEENQQSNDMGKMCSETYLYSLFIHDQELPKDQTRRFGYQSWSSPRARTIVIASYLDFVFRRRSQEPNVDPSIIEPHPDLHENYKAPPRWHEAIFDFWRTACIKGKEGILPASLKYIVNTRIKDDVTVYMIDEISNEENIPLKVAREFDSFNANFYALIGTPVGQLVTNLLGDYARDLATMASGPSKRLSKLKTIDKIRIARWKPRGFGQQHSIVFILRDIQAGASLSAITDLNNLPKHTDVIFETRHRNIRYHYARGVSLWKEISQSLATLLEPTFPDLSTPSWSVDGNLISFMAANKEDCDSHGFLSALNGRRHNIQNGRLCSDAYARSNASSKSGLPKGTLNQFQYIDWFAPKPGFIVSTHQAERINDAELEFENNSEPSEPSVPDPLPDEDWDFIAPILWYQATATRWKEVCQEQGEPPSKVQEVVLTGISDATTIGIIQDICYNEQSHLQNGLLTFDPSSPNFYILLGTWNGEGLANLTSKYSRLLATTDGDSVTMVKTIDTITITDEPRAYMAFTFKDIGFPAQPQPYESGSQLALPSSTISQGV